MTLRTLAPYDFPAKDVVGNFPAPLLYLCWEDHNLFCSPVCIPAAPDTPFTALAAAILPGIYGAHPDFEKIDWSAVEWFKSGQPWQPDAAATLAGNGLKHKDVLRFRTPGLQGLQGSFS